MQCLKVHQEVTKAIISTPLTRCKQADPKHFRRSGSAGTQALQLAPPCLHAWTVALSSTAASGSCAAHHSESSLAVPMQARPKP